MSARARLGAALRPLADGLRGVARNPGLVALLLGLNLALALVAAAPLAAALRADLAHTGASARMLHGFDYEWWARFHADTRGPARDFGPELAGTGFAWRNAELLLRGAVPGGLFSGGAGASPFLLGVGALYWLLQQFVTGGLLSVLRAPSGGFTFRGFVHASGFYFPRLLRTGVLALAAAGLAFAAYAPLARWTDALARDAASERAALALLLGRQLALLALLALVHMVSSYAKVIVVSEERRSAALAVLSSAGFCARRLPAAAGQYLALAAVGLALLALFGWLDASLAVTGWRSQLPALLLFQGLVAARIGLRLWLLAAQVQLYQGDLR